MRFEVLDEFKKDLKQLLKKYHHLEEDLEVVKRVLEVSPGERPPFSSRIIDTGTTACLLKLKKIACRSRRDGGSDSGLQLVYAWFEKEKRIVFIELFHRNEKEAENRQRIIKHFK